MTAIPLSPGGIGVALTRGALRGGKPRYLEPRMMLQELDKPLPDHAGRAQNAYGNFAGHLCQRHGNGNALADESKRLILH